MNSNAPKNQIYLSPPHMGGKEQLLLEQAISANLDPVEGDHISAFEESIASFTGSPNVVAVESGTAAIHLALLILDVQPGDFVICQSLVFVGAINPIRYLRAIPVFVDSEPDTWNMCPDALEQAIIACNEGKINMESINGVSDQERAEWAKGTGKLKAIMPVHLYGMPAKMDAIMKVAGKYSLPVIENAAEALGSRVGDRLCGSIGQLGVVSFNGNKIVTTGGGGALLSSDKKLTDKARELLSLGSDETHEEHTHVGYNYRMSNVLAGVGLAQMELLQQRITQRRANYDFYYKLLSSYPGISFLPEPSGQFANRWLTVILVDPAKTGGVTRDDIRQALEKENIESRPLWKPMHQQPVFDGFPFVGGGVADRCFEIGLCLPSGSNLSDDDKERIASVLKAVLRFE